MSYIDEGFDKFFKRKQEKGTPSTITHQATDVLIDGMSGDKIIGGIIESNNGKLSIDLENGKIIYNDGVVDLVSVGGDDNNLVIKDKDNTTIISTDGTYKRTGDNGEPSHGLTSSDDLYIGGKLEVDGNSYFDGELTPVGRLMLPMAELSYFSMVGSNIVIAAQSNGLTNMVAVNPATTLISDMEFTSGGQNGRLQYTGETTKIFHTACTISFAGTGANDVFVVGMAKNGSVVAPSRILIKLQVASDVRSTALHSMITLSKNDYIEMYVGNTTDADDFTIHSLTMFAMGM